MSGSQYEISGGDHFIYHGIYTTTMIKIHDLEAPSEHSRIIKTIMDVSRAEDKNTAQSLLLNISPSEWLAFESYLSSTRR